MLITSPIGHTVEQVLRDRQGRLVRATFYVYECAGRVKARLVEVQIIEEALKLAGEVLRLASGKVEMVKKLVEIVFGGPRLVLAYQNFYFSGSKPRAPTLVS